MQRRTGTIDADLVSANRMEPTVAVDTTETVAFANERFYSVSGLDCDTTIGADLVVLRHVIGEGFDALQEAVRAVLAGDADDERVELSMIHPAEAPVPRRLPAEARVTPIRSGVSDVGALVSIRGIGKRREYERRLERQNERLEEFASVVAHDLRNPLNVAAGRLELFEADGTHDSEHLAAIDDALDRMRAIVDETLTLAKQGRHVGETERVLFAEFADRCWQTVETHGATLDVAVDSDTVLLADADRFRHLLENLFRNAVEHGQESTDGQFVHIRVGVLRDGDDPIGFYVEDDGPGVPADEREQVFEPGYTTIPEGTGYGLPIVTWIAEAHDWTVSVTEGTDAGARFEFTGVAFE
jgi:signal transduction histidine kinase